MNVLVACEYSGIVRDAFLARGHTALSCDLLPSERPGPHYQGDVRDVLGRRWDLLIAHPPCTHLAVSGARHFATKQALGLQDDALAFVRLLLHANIPRICVENPVSIISSAIRQPDQVIQPWMFGHGETKATCLWLKNLPKLQPTQRVSGREPRVHHLPPSPERWKERSRTYTGIALAMAEQWNGDGVQLSLFDVPATDPRCRGCGLLITYTAPSRLCNNCLARCPQRQNKDGTTSYLFGRIAPANWQELLPWRDDFRMVNGVRTRTAYPLYYQDAAGVIWRKTDRIDASYEVADWKYKDVTR